MLPRLVALAAIVILTAGCAGVYTTKPIGDKPHALAPGEWEGSWVHDHDVTKVNVVDAPNGKLQLLRIGKRDERPVVLTATAVITSSGDRLFASFREEEDEPSRWSWGMIRVTPDQVLVWWPNLERFRELVRSGKLPGRLEGDDVHLEHLSAAQLQALTSGAFGNVFAAESPAVIRRVVR